MDSRREVTPRRVSFKTEFQSPSYSKGKLECWTRADQCLKTKEKATSSRSSCCSLEIPADNPVDAMEFLCRSWSPSASNFLQIFSSSHMSDCSDQGPNLLFLQNLLLPSHKNCSLGEHEHEGKLDDNHSSREQDEKVEIQETKGYAAQSNTTFSKVHVEKIWRWLTIQRSVPFVVPRPKSLLSLLRRGRVKIKEEDRLRTANIHAALSVARLAAAIAGFAANSSTEAAAIKDANKSITNGSNAVALDMTMSNIVASAAALVATVCAEAAESVGAHRAHVASAVDLGLATHTPADMVTLTATAATCLRGAALLKSRAMTYGNFPRSLQLLEVGAKLPVVTPSGCKRRSWVSIYSKHKQLMLSLAKKYLGVLKISKEYKILHVRDKTEEAQEGNYSISLKSNTGDIKLWFEDEDQSLLWISTISSLLQMHNSS